MKNTRSFKQRLTKVFRHRRAEQYDLALSEVEELLKSWPGNAQLYILWASLVQLTDDPSHSLEDAKQALQRAVEFDTNSPAGPIELGYYFDNVEDNPRAASKAFSEGIRSARRLLMDGLLGQARALLQLDKREAALMSLKEWLYLANIDNLPADRWKESFAAKIEDLLQELCSQRIMSP